MEKQKITLEELWDKMDNDADFDAAWHYEWTTRHSQDVDYVGDCRDNYGAEYYNVEVKY